MDTLTVKVHEYDEETHSLIVSFCTEDSNMSVDEYRKYSYNIQNYDLNNMQETLRQIAIHGLEIAKAQKLQEEVRTNDDYVSKAKSIVGLTMNYNVDTLVPQEGIKIV